MKIEKRINELLILLIAIVMVACAPSSPEGSGMQPTDEPATLEPTAELPTTSEDAATSGIQPNEALRDNPLLGTDWNLLSLNGSEPVGDITLTFDEETVGGSDGCNGYGATYSVDGESITFDTSGFMSTMMACEPMEIMEQGRAYLDALATATGYVLDAGTLTIQTEQGDLEFGIPQNVQLENTMWTLNAITEGDAVVSSAVDQDIYLTLADGVVSGSTGCNNLSGAYTLGGDELTFAPLAQTQMACLDEAVSQREMQFVDALNQTVRYSINRQTLSLEDADGNVLATFLTNESMPEGDMMDATNIDINETNWTLTSIITDDIGVNVGATITATFANGQLTGSAGCNNYTTSYLIDGTSITIEPIATTRKLCQPAVNAEEQAFLAKMAQVATFSASEDFLTLNDADGQSLLMFLRDGMASDDGEKTFFVGAEQADCVGVAPQKCLLVKEEPNAEYEFFYSSIAGFEWEAGYEYELRVRVTEVENPPADASKFQYELIEVVSKTAVEG